MKIRLPVECIEIIVILLPVKQRFQCATDFRLLFIQKQCFRLAVMNMDRASCLGRTDILEAWKSSGLALEYSFRSMLYAGFGNRKNDLIPSMLRVLEWWKNSGLFLKCVITKLHVTTPAILQWWESSDLIDTVSLRKIHHHFDGIDNPFFWLQWQTTRSESKKIVQDAMGDPESAWWYNPDPFVT